MIRARIYKLKRSNYHRTINVVLLYKNTESIEYKKKLSTVHITRISFVTFPFVENLK